MSAFLRRDPAIDILLQHAERHAPGAEHARVKFAQRERRAERRIISLEPPVELVFLKYINRLSDLLFVIARVANRRAGVAETEW